MSKLALFKEQFYKSSIVHLNNAGLQPISAPAQNKITYWAKRFYEEGFKTDSDYMADVKNTRVQLAKLIKCRSEEIAFFSSTAGAINQVAFSCGLQENDEVLMWDQEYSSHLYPWKAACDQAKAKLVLVESEHNLATPTEKYKAQINPKTKVLALSWVQFQSGAMMAELKELIRFAKAKNIYVFIDVMQGLGFLDFDLWSEGVDAVMGGSHKWLVSPVGVGFLAIKNELSLKFKPRVIGAYTYGTCDDPSDFECEPKRDASKFEPGSKQVLEITALGASLELLHEVGLSTIREEAFRLREFLKKHIQDLNFEIVEPVFNEQIIHQSQFVNFKFSALQLKNLNLTQVEALKKLSVYLNSKNILHALRGPGLRFTTQAFNTDEEIIFVARALQEFR